MNPCVIRSALPSDAASAVTVLRASITQLCVIDHQNDPATLERWLQNKTIPHFHQWLADPENSVHVAEIETELCGVGLLRKSGDLQLCYVQPGRQRSGIGSSLLRVLEATAKEWGLNTVRLISTATARTFYERHGYLSTGEESVPGFGVLRDYHYVKVLGA